MAKGQYVQPLTLEKAKVIINKVILSKLSSSEMSSEEETKLIQALPKVKKASTVKELTKALGTSAEVLNLLIQ